MIVGGGIVGSAIALDLSRRGFKAALIERSGGPKPYSLSDDDLRVYAISPGSVRYLQALGAWESVAACRVSPYRRMRVWGNDPARALCFDAAELGVPELGWIVEHTLLHDSLWQRLSAVRVLANSEVAAASFDESLAQLQLAGGLPAEASAQAGATLRCRLAVAAEGAQSKLRALAGIEAMDASYAQTAIVAHVATEHAHDETAWQRFLPTGPLAFLPLADGRSSIVWSADDALAAELKALDDAAFNQRLTEALQGVLGRCRLTTPRAGYPLRRLHAERYFAPGIALAGDAAHVVHPLAGQGLNLGLADACALAATLGDARAAGGDWAGARALARYERSRRADAREMLAVTDALARAFGVRATAWHTLLDAGLAAVDRLTPLKARFATRAMGL